MDYEKMTLLELEAYRYALGDEIRELKKELHESKLVWNSRQSEVKMKKLAENLSDKEKESLAQMISPKGIEVKEGVGKPNA